MRYDEAKCYALILLRNRLRKPWWSRDAIEATTYEGAGGPGMTGYLMSAGRISVPSCMRHGESGAHTFRLRDLLNEIEAGTAQYDTAHPQLDLFGAAA